MSCQAIRSWFRGFVISAVPSVPYIETTNQTPDPRNLPVLWSTLEFSSASEQRLTLGTQAIFREYGNVNVIVLGESGKGDNAVIGAAELFRTAFSSINVSVPVNTAVSGVGDLKIDAAEPPNTDPTESGNWFLASVSCSYTLDVVRGS